MCYYGAYYTYVSEGGIVARFNLVLPDEQLKRTQKVAEDRGETVTDVIRQFIRMGLLVDEMEKSGGELIARRAGSEQRLILL